LGFKGFKRFKVQRVQELQMAFLGSSLEDYRLLFHYDLRIARLVSKISSISIFSKQKRYALAYL
jgi:hypothetical protein